jgi:hypothetical protein
VAGVLLEGKAGGTGPSLVDDGVHLTGACSAEVSAAAVRGMAQAGVRIESTGSAVATVDGSTIRECGDTGVVVRVGGSPTVRLTGNTVTANSGTTTSGLDPDLRTVGGVLFSGVKPASLTFTGNRVYANRGDQVMVASSTPGWSLAGGTACAGSPAVPPNNLIACYDAATNGVGPGVGLSLVATSTGNVDARFNAWSGSPPQAGADFRVVAGGTIDAGAAATAYCQLPPGLCP